LSYIRVESYNVANTRRTFLGSRSHEEDRPKLLLLVIHLFSVLVLDMLLAVVTVIWWCTCCGFVEFCVDPTGTTVDLHDPNRAATVQWNPYSIYKVFSLHYKFTIVMSKFLII